MSDFYPGDRVVYVDDYREDLFGKEGAVKQEWCEYGDHVIGVDFDDGTYAEARLDYFEHVEDPYEYGVLRSSSVKSSIIGDHWADKEEQVDYLESLTQVLPKGVEYKLVKRRKAGRIEDV